MTDSNTMKRIVLMVIVALLGSFFSFSQEKMTDTSATAYSVPVAPGTVRLENDRDQLVFYGIFPLRAGEFASFKNQPSSFTDRLQEHRSELEYLAGGAVAPSVQISDTEQIVIGFTVETGASTWPVWYFKIPALSQRPAKAWYAFSSAKNLVDASQQQIALRSVDFELPARPVRIDGRFVDWLKFPDTLSFAENAVPLLVVQQNGGQSQNIAAASALSFRKAGTDLEHFRLIHDAREAFVMISSRTLMAPGISYRLRLYANDSESPNRYTLEIPLDASTGPVLLWTRGQKNPVAIGTYATADHYMEARFTYSQAGSGIENLFSGAWVVELSSVWSKSGLSEEFVWSRFPAASSQATR